HVESKDDILWELVSAAADRFFAAVKPIVESDVVTIEKIRRCVAAHVGVITSNLSAAAVYSTEWRYLSEGRRRQFADRRREYEQVFRRLISQGIREGTLADVDEKFAALLILSSMNWVYQWYRTDGPMTPEEIARTLTGMLLNGLKRVGS
ncbi:MAG: TetR/AcrR family transcriptional regulator, partial [Planctomycetota bacterium]